jgi:RNA polymerase sigma factor (sigma-70 family)
MSDTPGDLYLAHRAVIESVIRFVCRRRARPADDAEEFAADVRLRLVQSDYEILRKYEGRASIQTYLTVVIQRLALDYQAARWGRWRPSAMARAAGPAAVRLEQLVVRDGRTVGDALEIVERELAGVDRGALEALAPRFPVRERRQFVGDEVLNYVAAHSPSGEALLVRADEASRFERVKARLERVMSSLDPEDRLVLQLRFDQGMKVADIARLQHLDQKGLYRRIQHMLDVLREALEAEGLDAAAVRSMLTAVEPEASHGNLPDPSVYMKRTRHDH